MFVDCEGCLSDFFTTDIGKFLLLNVRYVVNEMDGNNSVITESLVKYGFRKLNQGYGCGTACVTEVWAKNIVEKFDVKYSQKFIGII